MESSSEKNVNRLRSDRIMLMSPWSRFFGPPRLYRVLLLSCKLAVGSSATMGYRKESTRTHGGPHSVRSSTGRVFMTAPLLVAWSQRQRPGSHALTLNLAVSHGPCVRVPSLQCIIHGRYNRQHEYLRRNRCVARVCCKSARHWLTAS